MVKNLLLAGAGGGIGAALRFTVYYFFRNTNSYFPTLLVNVAGSFLLGIILGISFRNYDEAAIRIFLATGICGGFTTFSAFSAEILALLQTGKILLATFYIIVSVLTGVTAVWLGMKMINL